MVFGTFDILHPGHLDFLKQAKRHGDFLIVSLARDKFIKKIKGRRAVHSEKQRVELLKALRLVNRVVLGSKDDYIGHIVSFRPNVIVLGYDQKHFTEKLKVKLRARGLAVKIFRAKPVRPAIYKSSKFLHVKAL